MISKEKKKGSSDPLLSPFPVKCPMGKNAHQIEAQHQEDSGRSLLHCVTFSCKLWFPRGKRAHHRLKLSITKKGREEIERIRSPRYSITFSFQMWFPRGMKKGCQTKASSWKKKGWRWMGLRESWLLRGVCKLLQRLNQSWKWQQQQASRVGENATIISDRVPTLIQFNLPSISPSSNALLLCCDAFTWHEMRSDQEELSKEDHRCCPLLVRPKVFLVLRFPLLHAFLNYFLPFQTAPGVLLLHHRLVLFLPHTDVCLCFATGPCLFLMLNRPSPLPMYYNCFLRLSK